MTVLSTLVLALAWQSPTTPAEPQAPLFKSDTALALVRFQATRKNAFIDDLRQEDVVLLEDGQPREIRVFEGGRQAPRNLPIEMVLLFDVSGSVRSAALLEPLVYQEALLNGLGNVRLSVYSFTTGLRRHCAPTRDPATLTAALRAVQEWQPNGSAAAENLALELPAGRKGAPETWLYEAMIGAARDRGAATDPATRMLVVFSDGFPTTTSTPEDAAARLSELGVPVFPVILGHAHVGEMKATGQFGAPQMAELYMADFARTAELTGGRSFDPPEINVAVVRQILVSLAALARNEYVVGFAPAASDGPPKRHRVEIRLRSKATGTLRGGVRWVVH